MKPDPTQCDGEVIRMIKAHQVRRKLRATFVAAALGLLGMAPLAHAQAEKINAVIGEQVRAEQAAQASQKRVAMLDSEATDDAG